jgi:hypothetical protein
MLNVNLFEGIVKNSIFDSFVEKRGINLFNYATNNCSIDDFLSISYVLCPDFIEVNGYIFISDLFSAFGEDAISKVKRLEHQFNYDKKMIEQWVNSWSLGDFFLGKYSATIENEKVIEQFGEVLIYYWTRRLKELFPEKKIAVEVGNEIMGELGLTITVYETM